MWQYWLKSIHLRLANSQSLIHFSIVGMLAGIWCALLVLFFRFLVEWPASLLLPGGQGENFEELPQWLHFTLPLGGAMIIGAVLSRMKAEDTQTGLVHVISRLHTRHGHLPLKNALVQLLAGAFALLSGQSGGREGPSVHLGAATNSLLGQYFQLPNNSIRVLVGCGTAGAIAAAFNTPIAGVIFAMEVVMMEYSIIGFTPVILSAVTATAVTQMVHGSDHFLTIPPSQLNSLWELPFITLGGFVVGLAAALLIQLIKLGISQHEKPYFIRATVAGLITGCCALMAPQILGIGYDTLNSSLASEYTVGLLLVLVVAKLCATGFSVGLGLPVGVIGPSLVIGACLGDVMGIAGNSLLPDYAADRSFYVMLGMGAMMGAVLNAPLAALMALLELTQNPNIIFPGMLAIIVATLTNTELCKQRSAHQTILHYLKYQLRTDPLSLSLQRSSVAGIMDRNVSAIPLQPSREEAEEILQQKRNWFLLQADEAEPLLIDAAITQLYIKEQLEQGATTIDLAGIKTHHLTVVELHMQATLHEASDLLNDSQADAIFVSGFVASSPYPDSGVLTRNDIKRYTTTPQ